MINSDELIDKSTANGSLLKDGLTDKLRNLRDCLCQNLVEREEAVRLGLLAALSGEHLLLIGPPGTAKSLVARRLRYAFKGANYFERLLTRFSVPEELFGPLSIKGLEEDRYERLTESYLPNASVAFLDEIFKANSAILNALLTLLNEREFDNGTRRIKTPLISVVGASNELPEGTELGALYDRFLLRLHVGSVSKGSFPQLLGLRGDPKANISDELQLTCEELEEIQMAANKVILPEDVIRLLSDLRDWCAAESIAISDRRWRKIVKLLQVSALTNSRDTVSIWDCWLLQNCVWEKPEQRESLYKWYTERVGTSAAMDPSRLTKIVVEYEFQLISDQNSRSQRKDKSGALLYQVQGGGTTTNPLGPKPKMRGAEILYLAPQNTYGTKSRDNNGKGYTMGELSNIQILVSNYDVPYFADWADKDKYIKDPNNLFTVQSQLDPALEATRHKPIYINSILNQLETLDKQVVEYKSQLMKHIASMRKEVTSHLWADPNFAEPAAATLTATRENVNSLHLRVGKLIKGFQELPQETSIEIEGTK
jgi:MoxR-like ATPase